MDLSIIVPFFQAERYIERCIDGLLKQDYPVDQYEILLVDNNSPDRSAEIARRYSRVKLLHEPKPGPYAARNHGARLATGAILVFIDADCHPASDWLSRLVRTMEDPGAELVVGAIRGSGDSLPLRLLGSYERSKEKYMLTSTDPSVYWGRAGNMAIRRTLWDDVGPFLEVRRGADVMLVHKVVDVRSRGVVRYEPKAEVEHMELVDARHFFGKIFAYSRSYQHYARRIGARALTNRERIAVLRQAVREERLSTIDAGVLSMLLLGGICFWYAGALTEAFRGAVDRSTADVQPPSSH